MRAFTYVLIGLLLLVPAFASAQTQFGGIRGAVRDTDGGVLPGTTVTLTNNDTAQARTSVTNERGEYVFARVAPGRYDLGVTIAGFAPYTREALDIGVDTQLVQDVTLTVGGIAESVTVTGETPLIETASASVASAITKAQMDVLPTPGRNVFIMSVTTPNVVHAGDPVFVRMQDQTNASLLSLGGGPLRGNNYTLDGVVITDFVNRAAINPSFDSLEEMKVQVNTYDSEMGGTAGGVFNSIHKSGSNNWAGAGLYQNRPTWGRSATFFEARDNQDPKDQPYHLWGGSFGGPIARDRVFFWWNHEGYKDTSSRNTDFFGPSRAMANGDFSELGFPIYHPVTGVAAPGGVIPAGDIDPFGRSLANQLADVGEACGATGPGNPCSLTALNKNLAWQMSTNINASVTDNWQLTGTYMYYKSEEPSDPFYEAALGTLPAYDLGAVILFRNVNVVAINSTHIIGDTSVLTLRFGYQRFDDSPAAPKFGGSEAAALGLDGDTATTLNLQQFPQINEVDGYGIDDRTHGSWTVSDRIHASTGVSGVYSQFAGSHTIKVGASHRRAKIDWFRQGALTFDIPQRFTEGAGSPGDAIATMLYGFADSGSSELVENSFTNFGDYVGGFIQDDWRVNDKLVLNLGLRLEHATGMQESNNQLITGWEFNEPFPIQAPGLSLTGGALYAGVGGQQTETGDPPALKVGPRAGFAYTVNDSTVIRGGWGLFWAPLNTGQGPSITGYAALGFGASTSYISHENDGTGTLSDPFPIGINQPVGNTAGRLINVGQNVTFIDQFSTHPYFQKYSFDLQKDLGDNFIFKVGFVGSRGTNLNLGGTGAGARNLNQLDPGVAAALGSSVNDQVPNPMAGLGLGNDGATISRGQLARPFPQFREIRTGGFIARSTYEAVSFNLEKRFRGNWGARVNYTFSNQRDNVYETGNRRVSDEESTVYVNGRLEEDFGFSTLSSRHWLNVSGIYRFPGEGPVLGGWSASVTGIMRSGFPIAIKQSSNWGGGFGWDHQRPNTTGVDPVTSGSTGDRVDNYINSAAYSAVTNVGEIGNTPLRDGGNRTPWLKNWDVSFEKMTEITASQRFSIRIEFINLFNQPNWNGPRSVFGASNFGRITGQGGFPRVLQVMLKYMF